MCHMHADTHTHTAEAFNYILCHQEVFAGSIWRNVLQGSIFILVHTKRVSAVCPACVCGWVARVCVCVRALHIDFSCNI